MDGSTYYHHCTFLHRDPKLSRTYGARYAYSLCYLHEDGMGYSILYSVFLPWTLIDDDEKDRP
jgi:hypothetical protein